MTPSTTFGLEWHRAVAPVWEVGEIATYGLALSRLKHGFESRWGHQLFFIEALRDGFPSPSHRGRKRTSPEALVVAANAQETLGCRSTNPLLGRRLLTSSG